MTNLQQAGVLTDYPALVRYARKNGFKMRTKRGKLSQGASKSVLFSEVQPDRAFICIVKDAQGLRAASLTDALYSYSRKNRKNKFLPIFYSKATGRLAGIEHEIAMYQCETLSELPRPLPWMNAIQKLKNTPASELVYMDPNWIDATSATSPFDLADCLEHTHKGLVNALLDMTEHMAMQSTSYYFDPSPSNFMLRSNGQLVLNDLWY